MAKSKDGVAKQLFLHSRGRLTTTAEIQQAVINTDPNLLFVKDLEGRFVFANQATANIYGTSVESLIGKTDADFNSNAGEVEWYLRDDQFVITTHKEIFIPEERVTGADGKTRWFETIKIPLKVSSGETFVLGISTDITKRKQLFEQLLQSQKMEALGQLAGGVAHDFNNLLTVIMGCASVLDNSANLAPSTIKAVNSIRSAASKASDLTHKLLGFSRKGKNVSMPVDINKVILETLDILNRTMEEKVKITTELSKENPLISGDPVQIQQMILNLAINARDAMTLERGGTDGGLLSISSEKKLITDPGALNLNDGYYVKITISDTGGGIPEKIIPHIYEPFFTTKDSSFGTGLGLAVVYSIVTSHGGRIQVHSQPGSGTSFDVYLPIDTLHHGISEKAPDNKKIPKSLTCLKALIMDDSPEVLEASKLMLESLGHQADISDNDKETLRLLHEKNNAYHLIILDLVMPGYDAIATIKKIMEIRPNLKIIISTGCDKHKKIEELQTMGINNFLMKPYQIKDLDAMLKTITGDES